MKDKVMPLRISEELHRKFKSKAALEGKSMNALLKEWIENYVNEAKVKIPSRPKK